MKESTIYRAMKDTREEFDQINKNFEIVEEKIRYQKYAYYLLILLSLVHLIPHL